MQPTIESMEVGTWHFTWVSSPNYDMNTCMATLFGGEAWDLCYKLGRAKSETQFSTQVPRILLHRIVKIRRLYLYLTMYVSDFWRACKLGLCVHVGT